MSPDDRFTKTRTEIILGANEDVEWLPQTLLTHRAFNPELTESELLESASALVRSLIDDGYVTLHLESWEHPSWTRGEAMQQLESNEIDAMLANPQTWFWDQSRDDYYCLVATPKGQQEFYEVMGKPKRP